MQKKKARSMIEFQQMQVKLLYFIVYLATMNEFRQIIIFR